MVRRVTVPPGDRTLQERLNEDLLELKAVIVNRPTEWKKRWTRSARSEGRLEGRAEGELSGLRKGQAVTLTKLLIRRFGPLPDSVTQRIAQADSDTLEAWTLRVLDAGTLHDVLDS